MRSSPELDRRSILILALAAALSLGLYLLASAVHLRIGFPLDDSWIHLTYARNLALRGEWAFFPGIPSAGDTSPLWTVLLAPAFLLGLGPYAWTFFLGFSLLFAIALTLEKFARQFSSAYLPRWPLVGLTACFEWHLVWSAASGMETLLHGLLVTVILMRLCAPAPRPLTLGLLTGLSIWARPDGLTLLGPALFTFICIDSAAWRVKFQRVFLFFLGLLVLLLPYFLFNLSLSSLPFPGTFYAKQSEYAAWQMKPILERLGILLLQFFNGPSIVLLFGVIVWVGAAIRARQWGAVAGFLWFAGYLSIYFLRLPPYQNGRYVIPAMPIFFLWGALGLAEYFSKAATRPEARLRASQAALRFLAALVLFFWAAGARSYARDVAFIESNMVAVALWADSNLPPDALIAAHDIGALGFFDQHALLDLAGLVSPQMIPLMHDPQKIVEYLDQQGVNYLVLFPSTYPELTANSLPVFSAPGPLAVPMGGERLSVYLWK